MKTDPRSKYLKEGTLRNIIIMNILIFINLVLYQIFNVKFHQFVLIVLAVCLFFNKIVKQNSIFDEMNQLLFKSIEQYKQSQRIKIGTHQQVFFDDQIIQHYAYIKINQFLQDLMFIINKINDLMTQFLIKLTIIFFLIQTQSMIGANWIFINFMFLMLNLTQQSISFLKQFFKVQKNYQFFTISVIDSSQINKLNGLKNTQNQISKQVDDVQQQEVIQKIEQADKIIQRNQNIRQLLLKQTGSNSLKQQETKDIQNNLLNKTGAQLKNKVSVKKKLFIDIPNNIKLNSQITNQGKGLFTKK